ncbi:MAG: TolC family protein [bacterium JZ-2024 1]
MWFAERSAFGNPLTLSEALKIALERNPSILEARYRYEGRLASLKLTEKILFGIHLSGDLQWSPDQRGLTLIGGTLINSTGSSTTGSMGASRLFHNGNSLTFRFSENRIFQSALFGGPPEIKYFNELTLSYRRPLIASRRKIPGLTLSVAELDAFSAYWSYVSESNRIGLEVARAFAEWVRAVHLVGVRQAALVESELTLKSVTDRVRLGAAAPLERDFAESSFLQRQLDRNSALSARDSTRDTLQALLHTHLPDEPPDNWDDVSQTLDESMDRQEDFMDSFPSVEDTPAVLGATLSAESARRSAEKASAEQRRNLSLFISLTGQGTGSDYPRAWETFRYASWFVGIQYDETLGVLSHQQEVSRASVAAADEVLRGVISQTRVQMRQGYRNLRLSEAQAESARAAVRAAESALKGARARYEVGMGTLLDVLRAEADLLNARLAVIDAEHNRILAILSIASIRGNLVSVSARAA